MNFKTTTELSTKSILKIFLIAIGIYFFFLLRNVFLVVIFGIILSTSLEPIIKWMQKKLKINYGFSVSITYFGILFSALIIFLIATVPLAFQLNDLIKDMPGYIAKTEKWIKNQQTILQFLKEYDIDINNLSENINIPEIAKNASGVLAFFVSATGGVFGIFSQIINIFIVSLYISIQPKVVEVAIRYFLPSKQENNVIDIWVAIKGKLGNWMLGQIFLSLLIGIITFVGIVLIDLFAPGIGQYAFFLAVVAGITEIIPIVGPIIAGVVITVIGFLSGGWIAGLSGLIWTILVQQLEANLLQPRIMAKAADLNSLVVIISLMIGATLMGPIGMILAVPCSMVISIIIDFKKKGMLNNFFI